MEASSFLSKNVANYFDKWVGRGLYAEYQNSDYEKFFACSSLLKKPGKKILDVGCGVGVVSQRLKALGHRVTGLDLSPLAVKEALERKRIDEGIVEDFLTFQSSAKFDVILFFGILLIPDLGKALERALSHLEEGGEIFIFEHNYKNPYVKLSLNRPAIWDRVIERSEPLKPKAVTESRLVKESRGKIRWGNANYFTAFTFHPNYLIEVLHRTMEFIFSPLAKMVSTPVFSNVVIWVGTKARS